MSEQAVELLAPARDLETGLAAINCGADAVYIGATHFGAREAAANSLKAIEALARHAHRYWARVYVTVNTLLYDHELPEAERLIRRLYELGADALIIQDLGLLELDLPPLPLIASTQMHNHTPERVRFLEQAGFRRAILARELTLDEIRAIRAAAPQIELECFVHGALCVSYSGQCYLSYALGGRSGNRGQCAQPCRRRYSLRDGHGDILQKDRHLLCLRDLNLTGHLPELLAAGVTSLKIEGRLKDRAYVMNVVAHYRQRLDAILTKGYRRSSSGRVDCDFTPDPAKTFNRGYTTYFLHGRGAPLTAWDSPKAVGEPLGEVTALGRRSFRLAADAGLRPGDGLCFVGPEGELHGTTVTAVRGAEVRPERMEGLAVGTQVYRNHDRAFLATLEKSATQRSIAVTLHLRATAGGLALEVRDEDGNEARHELACEKERAHKPAQALATMEKQLRSLGGTEFTCAGLEIDLPEAYFLPVSALNGLRRGAVEALVRARERNRPRWTGGAAGGDVPFPETELGFEGNVLNRRAEAFYRRHGVTRIEPAAESGLDLRGRRAMTCRYCLRYELGGCPKEVGSAPAEPLTLVDEQGRELTLRFDCARCRMEVYG